MVPSGAQNIPLATRGGAARRKERMASRTSFLAATGGAGPTGGAGRRASSPVPRVFAWPLFLGFPLSFASGDHLLASGSLAHHVDVVPEREPAVERPTRVRLLRQQPDLGRAGLERQ